MDEDDFSAFPVDEVIFHYLSLGQGDDRRHNCRKSKESHDITYGTAILRLNASVNGNRCSSILRKAHIRYYIFITARTIDRMAKSGTGHFYHSAQSYTFSQYKSGNR